MSPERPGYVYIWSYHVHPDHLASFELEYGSQGSWQKLFRRAAGYVRTELHRDLRNPDCYLTIDYWESALAWDAFRAEHAEEFEAIDELCEGYTLAEEEVARLEPLG